MSLKPWREVIVPHADVLNGTFQQSEFAADLTAVQTGRATAEYGNAQAFYERTFITEGMGKLLTQVSQRLNGKGGEPVIQLQTAFGGGKTHTMLAVYHLASRQCALGQLLGIPALLDHAGLMDVPQSRVAVLDGTAHSPGQPWKHDHQAIRTLWGELAWQLGKADGFALVREADANGTSPGKDALCTLLSRYAPCVVLLDELVVYIRQFVESQPLSGGTYDSNLSFVQSLTEAAKLVPNAVVLASLPESNSQAGGPRGVAALQALEAVFNRVQALWKTVAPDEAFEIESDDTNFEETVTVSDEAVRWRARDASYLAGSWKALAKWIPRFAVEDFRAVADGPSNPHIRSVVRQPLTAAEKPIPVGVVSDTYHLAQHEEVVEMCFRGLRAHGIDTQTLRCEVGLTPLGEWMNFRAFFPDALSHTPADGKKLALRLECFNSVEGSSRLVILLGWFRFVCSNGLIVGETKAALRDVHDEHLNLEAIPDIIAKGLAKVKADLERLAIWEESTIELQTVERWVDTELAKRWGKKAACRTFHICRTGADVELTDPFAGGKASEKPTKPLDDVPGAAKPARNLYDVCQALSWVASHRNSAEERLEWQGNIPELINNLRTYPEAA